MGRGGANIIIRGAYRTYETNIDLKFVKRKCTRPNFRAKEFYTLKTRKSRLFCQQ